MMPSMTETDYMKAARRRRDFFWITHAQFVIFNVKIASNIAIRDGFCEGE